MEGLGSVPQLVEVLLAGPGEEEVQVTEEELVMQQETNRGRIVTAGKIMVVKAVIKIVIFLPFNQN